jgi:hypothetical protein
VDNQTLSGLRSYTACLESDLDLPKLYLDAAREEALLARGAALGLSPANAERCLLLSCEKKGIEVERVLHEVFRSRVAAAVQDKLLDEIEHGELERQGLKIFAKAEAPAAITERILEEVRSAADALSEAEVKAILFGRVKKSESLSQEDWEELRRGAVEELRVKGVSREENDLGEILERARAERGVVLQPPANFPMMMVWMLFVAAAVFLIGKLVLHI